MLKNFLMQTPSPHSDSRGHKLKQASKNTPQKGPFQKGFEALKSIAAIRALVAISAIAAAAYGAHYYSAQSDAEAEIQEKEQEKERETMKLYTPEAYPTVESRVTYLLEKYGLEASVLDGEALHDENHITIRTETKECDCVKEHFTEHDLPRKVEKGDPKNFLSFLHDICRAADKYPFDLFKKMRGLKIYMSGKIEVDGLSGGIAAGYADSEGLHIVMTYFPDTRENQNVFDHEFFHSLDARHNNLMQDDDQWIEKVQSKGKYKGYEITLDDYPWTPPEGFARKYGMASVPEDQATIAENVLQPHYLKFMLRRAMQGDSALLMRIQLLTGSIIDPDAERFSRTMTLEEYKKYSGFDDYRYFRAWSPKMDYTYWNAVLHQTSTEQDSRIGVARNMYDANADLVSHIVGDAALHGDQHDVAAQSYQLAHESKLATKEYLIAAEVAEKKEDWESAALAYDGMGEKVKAKLFYEKCALREVASRDFSGAALSYAKAGNKEKAQLYALKFLEAMNATKDSPIKITTGTGVELHIMDDLLMEVFEQCYLWKNIPDIGIDLLHTMAKKRGGMVAITIYEKLGEVQQRAIESAAPKKDTKHSKSTVTSRSASDMEALVDRWYLKMAKRLESRSEDLDKVALLYEKGGSYDDALRCLEKYRDSSSILDLSNLADAYRKLADLESRKK